MIDVKMAVFVEADCAELFKYSFIELIECLFSWCSATWCNQLISKLPVDKTFY